MFFVLSKTKRIIVLFIKSLGPLDQHSYLLMNIIHCNYIIDLIMIVHILLLSPSAWWRSTHTKWQSRWLASISAPSCSEWIKLERCSVSQLMNKTSGITHAISNTHTHSTHTVQYVAKSSMFRGRSELFK